MHTDAFRVLGALSSMSVKYTCIISLAKIYTHVLLKHTIKIVNDRIFTVFLFQVKTGCVQCPRSHKNAISTYLKDGFA